MPNSIPPLEGEARKEDMDPKAVGGSAPINADATNVVNMSTLIYIYPFVVRKHRCTHNPPVNPGMRL